MSKTRTALFFSMLTRASTDLLAIASLVVLSRVLTPEEIGIFALASTIIVVLEQIRNFGTGQYVIQTEVLTPHKIRASIGVLTLISWSIGGILLLSTSMVAGFYAEPRLEPVVLIVCCNFFAVPLNGITPSYLRREMQFDKLLAVRVSERFVYAGVAITLALLGFSATSMAWASLTATITAVIALNYFRPTDVPFLPSFRGIASIFSFGSMATGASMARGLALSAPNLLIGKALSLDAVGLFSRAFGLVSIFERGLVRGIQPVILPHLAHVNRQTGGGAAAYLRATALLTSLAWPFYGFLALMAYPVTRILFGDQWDATVPITQVLCATAALRALCQFAPQLLVALGAVGKVLLYETVMLIVDVLLVLLAVHQGGLIFVAGALCVSGLLRVLLSTYLLSLFAAVSAGAIIKAVGKSAVVAVCATLGPLLIVKVMTIGPQNLWAPVLVGLFLCIAGWCAGACTTRHEAWIEIRSLIRNVRSRRGFRELFSRSK